MIELPFPPSSLSGHAKGHWHGKSSVTAKWRAWAKSAALAAKVTAPETGDIIIRVRFVPPNRRGDRVNFPNRCKPIFDGIADALKVNDARFLPVFEFAEPEAPGRVEISFDQQRVIHGSPLPFAAPPSHDSVDGVEVARPVSARTLEPASDHNASCRSVRL